MDVTLVRIIIPLLTEAATQSSLWFEFFKVLFQGFITAGFGLLVALRLKHIWFDAEKKKKEENERVLMLEELKDLHRHFHANHAVLAALLTQGSVRIPPCKPSLVHVRQLEVPLDYFILNKTTLHGLNSAYTRPVSKLNVVIRNRNIEAQELRALVEAKDFDWPTTAVLIKYMLDRYEDRLFPEMKKCREQLKDPEWEVEYQPGTLMERSDGSGEKKREIMFIPDRPASSGTFADRILNLIIHLFRSS